MIRICIIPPTPHMELANLGEMHFILAQRVLKDFRYAGYYQKSRTKYKIMDNGAYENQLLNYDQIFEAAKIVDAHEIVAPDFPLRPVETLQATKDFLSVASKQYKYMGVPHGTSVLDYCSSYTDISELEVNSIGFSILDLWKKKEAWDCARLRPLIIAKLFTDAWQVTKNHHLLGLDSPLELYAYNGVPIRSVDTSLPISLAAANHRLTLVPPNHKRVSDSAKLNLQQLSTAEVNIRMLYNISQIASSQELTRQPDSE